MKPLFQSPTTAFLYIFLLLTCCKTPPERGSLMKNSSRELHSFKTAGDTADINAQIRIAGAIWEQNQDSAKYLLINAAEQSIAQEYHLGSTRAYTFLGNKYMESARYDSSIYYLKLSLSSSLKVSPNDDYTARIYANMGALDYHHSKFDRASFYMYKALMSLQTGPVRNYKNAHIVYKFLGAFWLNQDNINNAKPYLVKAEQIARLYKDESLLMDALHDKATIYYRQKKLDSAIYFYEKVLESPNANLSTLANANLNLGKMYLRSQDKNQPERAIPYLHEARRLDKKMNRRGGVAQVNALLGAAYSILGDHSKAESMLVAVIDSAGKTGLGDAIAGTHKNLAVVYYNQKQYKRAFDQLLRSIDIKDSIFKKENFEMMGNLEMKYRVAEKDRQLAQTQLQISHQVSQIKERNFLIGGIATAALLFSALMASLFRNYRKKEEIARLKSMMQGEEKERARIAHELHDGIISELSAVKMHFSAIEYQVKEHAAASEFREAMTQLEDTTEELRKTSHNLMPEILIQSGIGIAVHSFCEKLRKSTTIHIDFQAYGEIPRLNLEFELTIYRIIQELVQNILKHARASHILVQLSCEDQLLTVTVEDNGKGIPDQVMSDGMGLNNIKTRVKALDGQINIESGPAGTSIYLEFNISSHY